MYWCAADIGWVTGHSYIVYGPLANGATSVLYEGTPDFPDRDRWWSIIERYGVTTLYTAPTAIRTFMKWGTELPRRARPVEPAGARLGRRADQPRSVDLVLESHRRRPLPDRRHVVADRDRGHHDLAAARGDDSEAGKRDVPAAGDRGRGRRRRRQDRRRGGGYLILTRPWPAMLRGIYGDPERYRQTYWSRFEGRYFAGDGAKVDEDGYLWLLGRVDDVMNVSGHRVSTTEVESALVDHPSVAEAAVVGATDATTGQVIIAFVTLKQGLEVGDEHAEVLRAHVVEKIGAIARPRVIIFTDDLPKTRSGKIMRRLLRDVAEGRDLGDTTTLADPAVVAELRRRATAGAGEE